MPRECRLADALFQERFLSRKPCASGVSGRLRTKTFKCTSEFRFCDDSRAQSPFARSESSAADLFVHQPPSFSASADSWLALMVSLRALHARVLRTGPAPLRAAGAGRRPRFSSGNPSGSSPSSAIRRSHESANSKAPARAVPERPQLPALAFSPPPPPPPPAQGQRHVFIRRSTVVGGVLPAPPAAPMAPELAGAQSAIPG